MQREDLSKQMLKALKKGDVQTLSLLQGEYGALDETPAAQGKRYVTNDATIQKLHELLSQNKRGLLLFRDELVAVGAGNVISTGADLMKWGRYLFKEAPEEVREVMLKDYGEDSDGDRINLGLSTEETQKLGPLIGHQGSLDSFGSFFGYAPQTDTLIVMLSNNKTETTAALMEKLGSWIEEPSEP